VYCPQCGTEYREGFTECSDCRIPLVDGPPPQESTEFDPDMDLVVVLETNDRVKAAMARGVLDEAGIPYFVLGQITTLVNDVDPSLGKWVRFQVARDREAEAKELLEQMLQPVTDAEALDDESAQ
jgi:hypothetical protein